MSQPSPSRGSASPPYLNHPVLGRRPTVCPHRRGHRGQNRRRIFCPVDAMKLRSSMTLFAAAAPEGTVFGEVLARHFGGVLNDATLARL